MDDGETPEIAFRRLHALAARGYMPIIEPGDCPDALELYHAMNPRGFEYRKDSKFPFIYLYPDGLLAAPHIAPGTGTPDRARILPDDDEGFKALVGSIPLPTGWDRFSVAVRKLQNRFTFLAVAGTVCLTGVLVVTLALLGIFSLALYVLHIRWPY
jgi:hypothetical protein